MVFDALGVGLESEDETGHADADEVKKRHLDGGVGVLEWEDDEEDGEDGGVDGLGEEEGGGALEIVDGLTTLGDDSGDGFEVGI